MKNHNLLFNNIHAFSLVLVGKESQTDKVTLARLHRWTPKEQNRDIEWSQMKMNSSGLWEGQLVQNEAKSVCVQNSIECKIMAPLCCRLIRKWIHRCSFRKHICWAQISQTIWSDWETWIDGDTQMSPSYLKVIRLVLLRRDSAARIE